MFNLYVGKFFGIIGFLMNYPKFKDEQVNFILNLGGLGDNIARLPALKYVYNRHPHLTPIVWIADYFYEVATNALPEITFKKFSQSKEFNNNLPGRSTGLEVFTNLKTHMVDHAFCLIANEQPAIEHRNYLKVNTNPVAINKFNLPKRYCVFTTCFTAPIREWPPKIVNEVVNHVISKGYKVVFLGQKRTDAGVQGHEIIGNLREDIDFSKGINLIDKTTLLEAAKIMSKSELVLGIDNGLLHLAAMTDAKILGGFTSVDPIHRLPVRNNIFGHNYWTVVPPDSEPEKFCQSIWDFTFKHDFKFSYYGNDNLINSLTAEMWKQKIDEILK